MRGFINFLHFNTLRGKLIVALIVVSILVIAVTWIIKYINEPEVEFYKLRLK